MLKRQTLLAFSILLVYSLVISTSIQAQSSFIKASLNDQQQLVLTNNKTVTLKVSVAKDGSLSTTTKYLQPGQSKVFTEELSRQTARKVNVTTGYDQNAYEIDLQRVQYVYEQRERSRRNEIIAKAFLIGLDEAVFGGFFSNAYMVFEYGDMIFNGATAEQWESKLAMDIAGNAAVNSVDKKWQKGAVAATFQLAELLQEGRYADLEQYLDFSWNTLNSNKMTSYSNAGNYSLNFPRKATFSRLALELSSGIGEQITYEENEEEIWTAESLSWVNPFQDQKFSAYNIRARIDGPNLGIYGGIGQTALLLADDHLTADALQLRWWELGLNLHAGLNLKKGVGVMLDASLGYARQAEQHYLSASATDDAWKTTTGGKARDMIAGDIGVALTFNRGWAIKAALHNATANSSEENDTEWIYNRKQLTAGLIVPLWRFHWE